MLNESEILKTIRIDEETIQNVEEISSSMKTIDEDSIDEVLALDKLRLDVTLLLDEMCFNLKDCLIDMGCQVDYVKEVIDILSPNKSIKDYQILNYAIRHNVIVVTKDQGLAWRCFKLKIPYINLSSFLREVSIIIENVRDRQQVKMNEYKSLKEYL